MFRLDWGYMRPAFLVMAIALALPLIVKLLGFNYYQQISNQYEQKTTEYNEQNAELIWINEGQEIVKTFKTGFVRLENAGLFDDQRRVEWVDAINKARAAMKLPAVRYQILPQRPYVAGYLQPTEHVSVMLNEIQLEAELLHEGDLVDLFGWMERYVPGQLHLSQCELVRIEAVFDYYSAGHPNMKAMCNFSWLTIIPQQKAGING